MKPISKNSFFNPITNQIVQQLENRVPPWEQPWSTEPLTLGQAVKIYLNREDEALSDRCDSIVDNMPVRPQIRHDEDDCIYNAEYDYISMPVMRFFPNPVHYHVTRFHMLINATGASSRLNRIEVLHQTEIADEFHSIEELISELGACYLAIHVGIDFNDLENNVAYIKQCLEWLNKDTSVLKYASPYAESAVNYILRKGIVNSLLATNSILYQ